MAVPISQMATVTKYVLTQKLSGVKRYPLVLMLEPLFRCNLACAGCGKIQYPDHVLDKRLTVEVGNADVPLRIWPVAPRARPEHPHPELTRPRIAPPHTIVQQMQWAIRKAAYAARR